jgi:hypothetical protein
MYRATAASTVASTEVVAMFRLVGVAPVRNPWDGDVRTALRADDSYLPASDPQTKGGSEPGRPDREG